MAKDERQGPGRASYFLQTPKCRKSFLLSMDQNTNNTQNIPTWVAQLKKINCSSYQLFRKVNAAKRKGIPKLLPTRSNSRKRESWARCEDCIGEHGGSDCAEICSAGHTRRPWVNIEGFYQWLPSALEWHLRPTWSTGQEEMVDDSNRLVPGCMSGCLV